MTRPFNQVEFPSGDAQLHGRLYVPTDGHQPRPCVVMAPGFAATLTMAAAEHAEALVDAGYVVLLFDHAGFGWSEGEPRQVVNPWRQVDGYRSAVSYAVTRPEVDQARIALWGFSYSAAVALAATATDPRVAAVIALVPALGASLPPADPDGSLVAALSEALLGGPSAWPPGRQVGPLPVVSADQMGSPSMITPVSAFRWAIEHGGRHGSGWQNVASVMISKERPFHAGLCTPRLAVPSLWLVAADDEVPGADPSVCRAAYEVAGGEKELHEVDGGHFGVLTPANEPFTAATGWQRDFLRRALDE